MATNEARRRGTHCTSLAPSIAEYYGRPTHRQHSPALGPEPRHRKPPLTSCVIHAQPGEM
eukprot:scaffold71444_cov29-Tisochrysis_lutea.AAC.1